MPPVSPTIRTVSAPASTGTDSSYSSEIPTLALPWSEVLDSEGEDSETIGEGQRHKIGVGRGHLVLLAIACGLSVWLADYLLRLVA